MVDVHCFSVDFDVGVVETFSSCECNFEVVSGLRFSGWHELFESFLDG